MVIGLGPGNIVLDADPAPRSKGPSPPTFWGHIYCGQTIAHLSCCWALIAIRAKVNATRTDKKYL